MRRRRRAPARDPNVNPPSQGCYYVDGKRRLFYIEVGGPPVIAFGSSIAAFAYLPESKLIAVALPSSSISAFSSTSVPADGSQCQKNRWTSVIRVYLARGEGHGTLGDMLEEVETCETTALTWVGDRYLAAASEAGRCRVFERRAGKLIFLFDDPSQALYAHLGKLAFVHQETCTISYRDLASGKVWQIYQPPVEKDHAIVDVHAAGNFGFVLYSSGVVAVFYAARGGIRDLCILRGLFSMSDIKPWPPRSVHQLIASPISTRKAFIAIAGGHRVYKVELRGEKTVTASYRASFPVSHALVEVCRDGTHCLTKTTTLLADDFQMLPLKFREAAGQLDPESTSLSDADHHGPPSSGEATVAYGTSSLAGLARKKSGGGGGAAQGGRCHHRTAQSGTETDSSGDGTDEEHSDFSLSGDVTECDDMEDEHTLATALRNLTIATAMCIWVTGACFAVLRARRIL